MRHLFRFLTVFGFLSLVLLHPLQAQKVYTVDDVPNVQLRDRDNAVSNPDGILSPQTVSQINNIIIPLRRATSIEVAVVAISSIGDDTPEDFSVKLFEKWGIGKAGEDNGLLILLSSNDRFIRFEVGYGLEGVLTDAVTRRIRDNRMVPYLAVGDWNNGMLAGVEAVNEYLTDPNSDLRREAEGIDRPKDNFLFNISLLMGAMIVIVLISFFSSRRARKCPRCGTLMRNNGETSYNISPQVKVISSHLLCPKCGYKTSRQTRQNISSGGGFGGMMGGGMMGGGMGRGGGGFGGRGFGGGGGFGGGRSGGGGGTSRF